MDKSTMVLLKKENIMGLALFHSMTPKSIQESSKMVSSKESGNITGKMETNIMDSILLIKDVVMVLLKEKDMNGQVLGNTEREEKRTNFNKNPW